MGEEDVSQFYRRARGPRWRKAKLRRTHHDGTPARHDLPGGPFNVQFVAFKLTFEGEQTAHECELRLDTVEQIDDKGLWFGDDDEPPFTFWLQLIPWSQVLGFAVRPAT